MEYLYSFDGSLKQKLEWSERYRTQPELLKYANHVADRCELRPHIPFNPHIESAHFDEAANYWRVTTSDGWFLTRRFCIIATGCLSSVNKPDFEGLNRLKGNVYHTGEWPLEGVDFTGRSVGIIGTRPLQSNQYP
jgi:cyclohexanone monooxygenase